MILNNKILIFYFKKILIYHLRYQIIPVKRGKRGRGGIPSLYNSDEIHQLMTRKSRGGRKPGTSFSRRPTQLPPKGSIGDRYPSKERGGCLTRQDVENRYIAKNTALKLHKYADEMEKLGMEGAANQLRYMILRDFKK